MKIVIPDEILLRMETWCASAGGREVSGLGTIEVKDDNIHVTGAYLLDMGSEALTEIPPERIAALYQEGVKPAELKLWWHRHPVGNGRPGAHNWSGTDEGTIHDTPLGSSPDLVKWSVSIVRTPLGWVGRVDHYGKQKTNHLEVIQPFLPQAHEALLVLGTRKAISVPTKPRRQKPISIKEKQSLVDGVCEFLNVKRGGDKKNWLHRRLTDYDVDYDVYNEMIVLLRDGMPAEEVSEMYGLDLTGMKDLRLITWIEMEEAMLRRFDQEDQEWRSVQDSNYAD